MRRRHVALAGAILTLVLPAACSSSGPGPAAGPTGSTSASPAGSAGSTASASTTAGSSPPVAAGALELGEVAFPWASSVWARPVTAAPVATDSDGQVADLLGQVTGAYGGVAALNVSHFNVSAVTAPADQATVDVAWDNCQHKTYTPPALLGPGGQFTAVPIPADAIPASGTDAELTIWSPSTDRLWEFWQLHHRGSGWVACWGGRIDHVSRSPGYFTEGFGASATGLATVGGMVTMAEARAGVIDHALALAIIDPAPWDDVAWPAQRSDGSPDSTGLIAEGTRFRLDPTIDVSELKLTPIAAAIARAAQKYGFIVSDKASAVSVIAQSGAVVQLRTGTNPWIAILDGVRSYDALRDFPWQDLQALPAGWGR